MSAAHEGKMRDAIRRSLPKLADLHVELTEGNAHGPIRSAELANDVAAIARDLKGAFDWQPDGARARQARAKCTCEHARCVHLGHVDGEPCGFIDPDTDERCECKRFERKTP